MSAIKKLREFFNKLTQFDRYKTFIVDMTPLGLTCRNYAATLLIREQKHNRPKKYYNAERVQGILDGVSMLAEYRAERMA